jgi:hypothetical protein
MAMVTPEVSHRGGRFRLRAGPESRAFALDKSEAMREPRHAVRRRTPRGARLAALRRSRAGGVSQHTVWVPLRLLIQLTDA